MLEISKLRPQGEELEAHVRPHVPVTVEKPVTLEGRKVFNLQGRLIEVGHAEVEVGRPHLAVDVLVLDVAERQVDKTVRKLLKCKLVLAM